MSEKRPIKIETETDNKKTGSTQSKNWEEVSNRESEVAESSEAEPRGELEHFSYPELEKKLTETEQQSQKNYDNWLRLKAELDNFKRRSDKEKADALNYGISKLVKEIIPVVDSLEQGLNVGETVIVNNALLQQMRTGMELTHKMLLNTLKNYGIEVIDPQGQVFNPELHEAMSLQQQPDVAPNTVLSVFQKGFTLHGRLLRPARVVVSKA